MKHAKILLTLANVLVSCAVYAKTITVTSEADSGPKTLRHAVASAQDGDKIKFSSDVETITLTSGQIQIAVNLKIKGKDVTISGNNSSRIFEINAAKKVTLEGLQLTSGSSGLGGALLNKGTLTVKECSFEGNSVTSNGGAIFNDVEAELTVKECEFKKNSAGANGGAILITIENSRATIKDSIFKENSAQASGGAIDNIGTLIVKGSTFKDNFTTNSGGGAIINEAIATLKECDLSENSASSNHGGAIHNFGAGSTLTVEDSTIKENSAGAGGGIFNDPGALLTVKDSTVASNLPDNVTS